MSLGTVQVTRGLPHGGVRNQDGKLLTHGSATRGLDYREKLMVKTVKRGKAKIKVSRLVMATGIRRVGSSGNTYRLVQIPYTEEERIKARPKFQRVRPLHGEFLWADRSKLKPENPAGGRLDNIVERGNGFHWAWVNESRLEDVE